MPGQPAQSARWTRTLIKQLDDLPAHTAALLLTDFEDLHLPSIRGLPARLSRPQATGGKPDAQEARFLQKYPP